MVELKKEGYLNGEILSENETTIRFKDSRGAVMTLDKRDIVSMTKDQPSGAMSFLPRRAAVWADKVKRFFLELIAKVKPLYKKLLLPKPSERKVEWAETNRTKQINKL